MNDIRDCPKCGAKVYLTREPSLTVPEANLVVLACPREECGYRTRDFATVQHFIEVTEREIAK